jgi:hypothetical protein
MRAAEARKLVGIAVVAACALAVNAAARAQAPDPLVGTWKLDLAKSSYKPGPAPKSVTVVIEAAGGKALKIAVDAVMADGPMKWGYTNARDGKETPVTGNPNYDAVKVTQVSSTEGTIQYMKGGKPSLVAKTSVKDKTMTVTTTGTDSAGQSVHNVAVYTRQ